LAHARRLWRAPQASSFAQADMNAERAADLPGVAAAGSGIRAAGLSRRRRCVRNHAASVASHRSPMPKLIHFQIERSPGATGVIALSSGGARVSGGVGVAAAGCWMLGAGALREPGAGVTASVRAG